MIHNHLSMSHAATIRWPYFWTGSLLFCLGMIGYINSIPTLAASLAITAVCLVFTLFRRQDRSLSLMDVWLVAYLYIFLSEYVLNYDQVVLSFGSEITTQIEGFIVAAFGSTLVGYALSIIRMKHRFLDLPGMAQPDRVEKQEIPAKPLLLLLFLSVAAFYTLVFVMGIENVLSVARHQRDRLQDVGVAYSFLRAITVTFPAVTVYFLRNYKLSIPLKAWIIAVALLAALVIFASGTRLYFGFVVSGVAFFTFRGFKLAHRRQFLAIGLLVLLLLIVQGVTRSSRSEGIADVDVVQVVNDIVTDSRRLLSQEGLLRFNGWIHLSGHPYLFQQLPEHLFLVYWWVPRQWWPDKPAMYGYWVIREYGDISGFSRGHSADGSFVVPALLDFGPYLGAVFPLVYGMLLAAFEAFAIRHRSGTQPGSIMAAILYFGVFFMMRSLFTSLIIIIMIGITVVLPLIFATRPAREQRQNRYLAVQRPVARARTW